MLMPRARKIVCPIALVALVSVSPGSMAATPDFSVVPGIVVDWSPASSGVYVGSPSIAVMPDGTMVASHDEFGPNSTSPVDAVTRIFRSADQGATWSPIYTVDNGGSTTAYGAEWNSLFTQGNTLFLMGVSKDYGNIVIRKSTDDGTTWTVPSNSANGVLTPASGYHTSTQRVVVQDGRIWRAFEDIHGGTSWPNWFESFVMSAPVGADLTNAGSWTMSNALSKPASWTAASGNNGWLEGGLVSGPDGIANLLRVDTNGPQRAAIVKVDGPTSVSFDPAAGVVSFPGGATKFTIQYDESTGRYYTLSNPVPPGVVTTTPGSYRNTLALMSSPDLVHWRTDSVVLNSPDANKHGFQYVDWQFAGKDLVAASRTAYDDGVGGANSYHNANLLTFNRVENYAARAPNFTLVTDTGDATHASKVVVMQTVAGAGTQAMYNAQTFATGTYAGQALTDAFGIAQDLRGQVYVGEEKDGGRILRFDRSGNFLGVVATEGINFTGRPETLARGPDGMIYMSVAFGSNASDKIYRFNPSSGVAGVMTPFVATTGTGPGGTYTLSDPRGIALDQAGNLYVGDRNNDSIRKFNSTGQYLGTLATFGAAVQSLSFDAANNRLLVSLGSNMVIDAVSLTGTVSSVLSLGANTVLDAQNIGGNVFFTDYSASPPSIRRVDGTAAITVQTTASDLAVPGHLLAIGSNIATWSGTIDNAMSKAANWGLTVAPDFSGWESFKFTSPITTSINNDVTGAVIGGLLVQSGAGAHTITGNAFTLSTGAAIINDSSQPFVLTTGTITMNSLPIGGVDGDVVINSAVALANQATVTIRGTHLVTFNGPISGAGSLDALEGTAVLAGNANTYSGTTTIDGGVLRATAANALGATSSGTFIVGDGATGRLEIAGNINLPEPITIDARQYAGAAAAHVINVNGNNQISGPLTLTSTGGGTEWNLQSDAGTLIVSGTWSDTAVAGVQNLKLSGAGAGVIQSVVSDGPGSVTSVIKSGTGTWTLSGTDTFTGPTQVNGGALKINGAIASNAVAVASAASLSAVPISALSTRTKLTVNGTATLGGNTNAAQPVARTLASLTIGTGGAVTIVDTGTLRTGRNVLQLDSLSLAGGMNAWQAKLDLAGDDMVIHAANLAIIADQIRTGGVTTPVAGILSSAASADATHLTTLGAILNSSGTGTLIYGSKTPLGKFDGLDTVATDVLVKFTYYGDANLDGHVDGSDYTLIDYGFNTGVTGWLNGDFNYDGLIDGSDYTLIDNAFNTAAAPLGEVAGSTAAVPEPATVAIIAAWTSSLTLRRRSRLSPRQVTTC